MRMRMKKSQTDQANLTFTFTMAAPRCFLKQMSGSGHSDGGYSGNNSFGTGGNNEGFRGRGNNEGFCGGGDDEGFFFMDDEKRH